MTEKDLTKSGKISIQQSDELRSSERYFFEKIQNQRFKQRRLVFWLAWVSAISVLGSILLVLICISASIIKRNFSNYTFLYIFITTAFAYSFCVLKIITKSLYDDGHCKLRSFEKNGL
jgi:lipopolysaccharide export LptBFGC system permease protein LptF